MADLMTGPTDADFALMTDAVRGAAAIARQHFRADVASWDKAPGDPVSVVDLEINRYLHDRLAGPRDGYGWLSEESEDAPARLSCRRVWVVDPIDGTRAFLRGTPDFAISVALVEDGRPVMGAIHSPVDDDLFAARLGAGATVNGQPIRVSGRTDLSGARMLGEASFFRSKKYWPVAWPRMDHATVNSIALRLALVAAGRRDAIVTLRAKSDWDVAAGDIIVTEAGGTCTDEDGRPLTYNTATPEHRNVIAATPALIAPILDRVRPALARWRARQAEQAKGADTAQK